MAKNISLLGADYPGVPAVQLPQTGGGTATFYDIQVIDNLNSDSSTDALSAKQGKVLNGKTSLNIITDSSFSVAESNGIISNISEKVYGGYQFRVQKYGNIVSIQMYVELSPGTTDGTVIAVLKEGLRPHYFVIANATDSNFIVQSYGVNISSNGNINFRTQNTLTQNTAIRCTVVFIAD